jgi:large subunit ribosomal protein L21
MHAIFEDGSRQYRVSEGDVVRVDHREAALGSRVEFPRVLLCGNGNDVTIGQPVIEGARVLGTVVAQPSTKVYVQHFRRRKNYRRLKGHRQHYVEVKVTNILLAGQAAPDAPTVS